MELALDVNQTSIPPQEVLPDKPLDRRVAFRIWALTPTGKSQAVIARELGISPQAVSSLIKKPRISSERHAQLVAAGVPEKFLPPVEDVKPGPSLKAAHHPAREE